MTATAASSGRKQKDASSPRRVAGATFIGSTIENYDFLLYGTAAALFFDELFFPTYSPAAGVLAALGANAVGFLARPLGGMIAGQLGDRVGRKALLIASILCMGIPTTLIGVLPTYAQVGVLAPTLLVLMRILQGIGLGAEFGGAATLASEHSPPGRRGLYNSFNGLGSPGGMILSTSLVALVRVLTTDDQFMSWGWRIPFLASAVLVVAGIVIRTRIDDGPAFQELKDRGEVLKYPLVEAVRRHPKEIVVGLGIRMLQNSMYWLLSVFSLTYLKDILGDSSDVGLAAILTAACLSFGALPAFAMLSDRVGRKPVYLGGVVGAFIGTTVFFAGAEAQSTTLIFLGIGIAMNLGHDALAGPLYAWLAEMFSTATRYSGVSITFQVSSVIAGGLSPIIAVALLTAGGGAPWLVLGYVGVLAIVSSAAALWATETSHLEITDLDARSYEEKTTS